MGTVPTVADDVSSSVTICSDNESLVSSLISDNSHDSTMSPPSPGFRVLIQSFDDRFGLQWRSEPVPF